MTPPSRTAIALISALAASCGAPRETTTAPSATPTPTPTPRPVPSPALVVVTAERTLAGEPVPAFLSLYAIGADGRLVLAGPPQPIGPATQVYAASYVPSTGLYRQLLVDEPFSWTSSRAVRLETYRVDHETAVFTRIGRQEVPFRTNVVAFHPGGRFLYASLGRQQLDGYELDADNGALLRAIPGAPFSWDAPVGLSQVSIAPSGRFAWGTGRIPDGYHHNHGFLVSFAVDPTTGAVTPASEVPLYDQSSDVAVTATEDIAYVLDRSLQGRGNSTWHRFELDASGTFGREKLLNGGWGTGTIRFTLSGRHLLGFDGSRLYLAGFAAGSPGPRAEVATPRVDSWDARRMVFQAGAFVYVGGQRSLAVVRLDEDAGTLEPVQEVTPGDTLQILAVAPALPPG